MHDTAALQQLLAVRVLKPANLTMTNSLTLLLGYLHATLV